jgi:hypothetical protein
MFKIRQSKYRHVYCDAPKNAVSEALAVIIKRPRRIDDAL